MVARETNEEIEASTSQRRIAQVPRFTFDPLGQIVGRPVTESGRHDPTRSVSLYRFDADPIVYRFTKSLFAAQRALRRLDRNMTQQELNLFEFTAGGMTEPGARSSQIVRRELRHLNSFCISFDHVPNDLLCHSVAPYRS
jgi:hypothetical protein